MITFSYCLDAAGNLIKLDLSRHSDALIPHAAELVSTAAELAHPVPWTKSVVEAVKEVLFVPHRLVVGTPAQLVHETRSLPKSAYVFVPPCTDPAQDEHVVELIDLYDEVPEGHEGRGEIVQALSSVGIELIPLISVFHPELHEGDPALRFDSYAKPGWLSHWKVYRKAHVA